MDHTTRKVFKQIILVLPITSRTTILITNSIEGDETTCFFNFVKCLISLKQVCGNVIEANL